MSGSRPPYVAFGLRALALALKARGNRATVQDALNLVDFCARTIPDDVPALLACTTFARTMRVAQPVAGSALQDFINTWRRGEMAADSARTEEALRDMAPEHFDWQDRKDCGHG